MCDVGEVAEAGGHPVDDGAAGDRVVDDAARGPDGVRARAGRARRARPARATASRPSRSSVAPSMGRRRSGKARAWAGRSRV